MRNCRFCRANNLTQHIDYYSEYLNTTLIDNLAQ